MGANCAEVEDERVKSKTHVSWNCARLSILCSLFVSFVLLYGCTYFSLKCELQQLRADVDQLLKLDSVTNNQNEDGSSNVDSERRGRPKRQASVNETASNNDTLEHEEKEDEGSGEVTTDPEFRGIWMGTYSRVPKSAVREYCLALTESCPPPIPGSPGAPGDRGPAGEPGRDGSPGTKGDRGAFGQKGMKGETGEKGDSGLPGVDGLAGTDGMNGTDGAKGRRGKRGRPGQPGEKGDKGDRGIQGPPGQLLHADTAQLIRGPRGMPGPPGLPGPKGDQGAPGDSCGCISTEATTVPTTTVEPTIAPRFRDCQIRIIGKPLFHKATATYWGMWLKDSRPHEQLGQRFWLTRHITGKTLYYYNSLENVKKGQPDGSYELTELYFGTDNVVYNGSFYYHRAGFNEIIKYDLVRNETAAKVAIPLAAFQGRDYLYSTEYNYFDLAVDANGLWAIYAAENERNFLLVSKMNPDDLTIEKTWNISVRHRQYGNGIIACGLLYLIGDVTSTSTIINYAFDLYTKQNLDVHLTFNNPYEMNTMIAFNHAERQIYSWDRGHLLTYPLLL